MKEEFRHKLWKLGLDPDAIDYFDDHPRVLLVLLRLVILWDSLARIAKRFLPTSRGKRSAKK